ncbi:Bardet-Biedl syndrome 7 protein homolog isoform X2 [Episyrphus balteatus]|uniref:Bardet-Biedl syndrome 7 protein homolog isoform X2 n=1 Tax=Episyrphus balteatus TaxID=286459 RepID=UPI002484F943|nr:Bardet-Biedl syndrome 7 protein homolog isoform X2 [Episyrphus balteatus]
MELELTKINYGSVNTTLPNCMKLISTGNTKKHQKVAVGDLDGHFQIFGIKKSDTQLVFQSYVGSKVLSIQMGGAPGSVLDKIFVASDNLIKAFTTKGKMFLSFDTNFTEPIKCMFVSGADLFICGNHVYSHYRDCKDIGTYLCGDTIVDVVALCPNNTNRILTVLACSGRVLRILEHCRVRQTVELDSVPTVLHVPKNVLGDRILCGFADGKIILYQFGPFTGEIKQRIMVDNVSNPWAVTCIDTYDLSGDGRDELIIGRRDGTVQVFTMSNDEDIDVECRQLYSESFLESISAVQGGCVFSQDWAEIVVLLYSGSIFGLTTQIIGVSLSNKEIIKPFSLKNLERISTSNDLKAASDNIIQTSLVKPIESYQLSQSMILNNSSFGFSIMDVNDSLTLDKNDKAYILFIELPTPILEIELESEIMINILNSEEDKNYNIDNVSENEYNFKGKITMKDNCNRFEMKFQTIEGQYGTLQALIIPRHQPHNVLNRLYTVRPLSLHFRVHKFDLTRPLNVLSLKGQFSHSEMHNWIEQCIPEVPERLSTTEFPDLYFENSLIGTMLECKYSKGNAQFRSDNLSTISIIKDFLTKEATKKRIKLEINTEISESSVSHVLMLIRHSIESCIKSKKEYQFLQALLQVDIRNDEDFNCLMPEYQSILNRRIEIEADYKKSPAILDKYFGIITDFYIDRFKFKGIFVRDKVPQLIESLENFNMNKILEFFNTSESKESNLEII